MKRVFLLIVTNLAVMLVLSVVVSLLGLDRALTQNGMNLGALLAVAAIFGFGGSLISLLLSKTVAKYSMGVRIIDSSRPGSEPEKWLVQTVERLARRANIGMPEVGMYEGAPNAFATGANRNSALVAVSTGLMQGMTRDEVEAVLGHEVAHVANGDMVTLTLIQGVVNTFVFFLARVIGTLVDRALSKDGHGSGAGYMLTVFVLQMVLGVLASAIVAWFSRQREFRADAGSAAYLGSPKSMIAALERLGTLATGALPAGMKAAGIASVGELFSTHPPLSERIAVLQAARGA